MVNFRSSTWAVVFAGAATVATALDAGAQPLGNFRWQLLPHCNVVTLSVTAEGGVFTLSGFDDQCGASQRASVVGTAFPNPDGTIGLGLNTVLAPGGAFVHVDARISLATLAGPWRDSSGNSGTLAFTPGPGVGGTARPVTLNGVAPGSVDRIHIAPAAVGALQIDSTQVQTRISGACPAGSSLRAIQPAGDVVCEPQAPGPMAYYTARPQQVPLPAGGAGLTILALRGLPAGTYLFNAHATAADLTTPLSFVRCAIRAAGADSSGTFGSTTAVGTGASASIVSQVSMSLPVVSAALFDAEFYCSSGNFAAGAYIEEPRLSAVRVAAVEIRPPTP
jgi:hypothetical protein